MSDDETYDSDGDVSRYLNFPPSPEEATLGGLFAPTNEQVQGNPAAQITEGQGQPAALIIEGQGQPPAPEFGVQPPTTQVQRQPAPDFGVQLPATEHPAPPLATHDAAPGVGLQAPTIYAVAEHDAAAPIINAGHYEAPGIDGGHHHATGMDAGLYQSLAMDVQPSHMLVPGMHQGYGFPADPTLVQGNGIHGEHHQAPIMDDQNFYQAPTIDSENREAPPIHSEHYQHHQAAIINAEHHQAVPPGGMAMDVVQPATNTLPPETMMQMLQAYGGFPYTTPPMQQGVDGGGVDAVSLLAGDSVLRRPPSPNLYAMMDDLAAMLDAGGVRYDVDDDAAMDDARDVCPAADAEEEDDAVFKPIVRGQLECSRCRPTREILDDIGIRKTYFVVHSTSPGTFEHAIIDGMAIGADGQFHTIELLYCDLRGRTHEWVQNFIAKNVEKMKNSGGQLQDICGPSNDGGQPQDICSPSNGGGQLQDICGPNNGGGQLQDIIGPSNDGGQLQDIIGPSNGGGQLQNIIGPSSDGGQLQDIIGLSNGGWQLQDIIGPSNGGTAARTNNIVSAPQPQDIINGGGQPLGNISAPQPSGHAHTEVERHARMQLEIDILNNILSGAAQQASRPEEAAQPAPQEQGNTVAPSVAEEAATEAAHQTTAGLTQAQENTDAPSVAEAAAATTEAAAPPPESTQPSVTPQAQDENNTDAAQPVADAATAVPEQAAAAAVPERIAPFNWEGFKPEILESSQIQPYDPASSGSVLMYPSLMEQLRQQELKKQERRKLSSMAVTDTPGYLNINDDHYANAPNFESEAFKLLCIRDPTYRMYKTRVCGLIRKIKKLEQSATKVGTGGLFAIKQKMDSFKSEKEKIYAAIKSALQVNNGKRNDGAGPSNVAANDNEAGPSNAAAGCSSNVAGPSGTK